MGLCLLYRSYPRKGQMSSINWYTPYSNYFSNSRYTYATCFYKRFLTHSENIKWNNPIYLKTVILITMLSKGCLFVLFFWFAPGEVLSPSREKSIDLNTCDTSVTRYACILVKCTPIFSPQLDYKFLTLLHIPLNNNCTTSGAVSGQ